MKRRDLEAHLRRYKCEVLREGGNHTVYENLTNGAKAAVPRHNEIKSTTVRAICKALDIPMP